MPREFVYSPPANRRFGVPSVGFRLRVPDNVTIIPGGAPLFHARETRDGKIHGELELTVVGAAMIMDRDGVLEELAQQAAAEISMPPRQASLLRASLIPLGGSEAYRVDLRLVSDELGRRPPPLPYVSTVALGHPDLITAAALFGVMRATADPWEAGEEMLDSLQLA